MLCRNLWYNRHLRSSTVLLVGLFLILISYKSSNQNSALFTSKLQESDSSDETVVSRKMNILFLMADDLRPQIEPYYGPLYHPAYSTQMKTPNFRRLGESSLLFERAYVQVPLCGPSRTSIFTSRRPDTTMVYGNKHYWRTHAGNFTTLPQFLKGNGYHALGIGKIFHGTVQSDNVRDPISWSEPFYFTTSDGKYESPNHLHTIRAVTKEERKKNPLSDDLCVNRTLQRLKELAPKARTGEKPFFMAFGFQRPHLSLICPKQYFDLYPLETDKSYLSDPKWQTPRGFHMPQAIKEKNSYYFTDQGLREARQAYFACISYIDDLLGQILDAVDELGLRDNTIISYVSDHGHHLGENNYWGKNRPFEISSHVPMMIRIPGVTDRGIRTKSVVEALDMAPTLHEALEFGKMPPCPRSSQDVEFCTDGKSLLSLLQNPEGHDGDHALSQTYPGHKWMLYSLRNNRFRYVHKAEIGYKKTKNSTYDVSFSLIQDDPDKMLFDHQTDPEEMTNVIDNPKYAKTADDMKSLLESKLHPMHGVKNRIYDK